MLTVLDHLERMERNLQLALQAWCEGMALRVNKLERLTTAIVESLTVLEQRIGTLEKGGFKHGK